jgi:ADP-heptose:LPS heptosyltransferase
MPNAAQKRRLAALATPMLALVFRAFRRKRLDLADPRDAAQVEKILAVRLDAIGDLLLTEPALGALRSRFPNARLDLLASPASAAVLEGNPAIDRVISYRAPWHEAWRGGTVDLRSEAGRLQRLTASLRSERYDAGFELRGDPRDIVLLAAALPRGLAGSGVRGGGALLDIDVPLDYWSGHQVENAVAIVSAGLPEQLPVRAPQLALPESARARADDLLPSGDAVVGLHLGAGFPSKQLPVEKFATVVRALRCRHSELSFAVVGTADESGLTRELERHAGMAVLDLTGRLSLLETAAVIQRMRLFIGNDSAPIHLAAAVGTPVVTFFGPSEPWKFYPYGVSHRLLYLGLECSPCDYVHCVWPERQKYQCMVRQDTDAIVQAAEELLARI